MILSRRIWLSLQTPPSTYWAGLVRDQDSDRYAYSPWAYVTVALLLLSAGTVFIVSGVLWGMFVAANTARALTHERRRDALDLLAITPLGHAGVQWHIFASILHYDIDPVHFNGLRRLAISVVVLPLGLLMPLLALVMFVDRSAVTLDTFFWLMLWVSLIPVVYLDPIYGLLVGGLVAILTGQRVRGDAAMQAVAVTVALKVAGYALAGIPAFVLLPLVWRGLNVWGWLSVLSIPLVALVLFVAYHETLLWLLWRRVARQAGSFIPVSG